MRILSIRQPLHLIASGTKNIENRTRSTPYRGSFLIHSSKTIDKEACRQYRLNSADLETGGVVGIAEIADCVTRHPSKWFTAPYGFVLRRPRKLPFVKWKGALGLRQAPASLLRRLNESVRPLQQEQFLKINRSRKNFSVSFLRQVLHPSRDSVRSDCEGRSACA